MLKYEGLIIIGAFVVILVMGLISSFVPWWLAIMLAVSVSVVLHLWLKKYRPEPKKPGRRSIDDAGINTLVERAKAQKADKNDRDFGLYVWVIVAILLVLIGLFFFFTQGGDAECVQEENPGCELLGEINQAAQESEVVSERGFLAGIRTWFFGNVWWIVIGLFGLSLVSMIIGRFTGGSKEKPAKSESGYGNDYDQHFQKLPWWVVFIYAAPRFSFNPFEYVWALEYSANQNGLEVSYNTLAWWIPGGDTTQDKTYRWRTIGTTTEKRFFPPLFWIKWGTVDFHQDEAGGSKLVHILVRDSAKAKETMDRLKS